MIISDGIFHFSSTLHLTRQRFDGRVDPRDVVGNASINAWRASASTTNTEADHTLESVSICTFEDEWSAGISLASVFASLTVTGAQHGGGIDANTLAAVLSGAAALTDDWHADLHQDARYVISSLSGQSPTSNYALDVIGDGFSFGGQASRLNGGVQFERSGQFDDGDIIQGGVRIVTLMSLDSRWTRSLHVGVRAVMIVGAGYDAIRGSVSDAMGGRDDDIGGDQSTTAKVALTHLQTDDPRVGTRTGFHPTDDTLSFRIVTTIRTHLRRLTAGLSESGRERCRQGN